MWCKMANFTDLNHLNCRILFSKRQRKKFFLVYIILTTYETWNATNLWVKSEMISADQHSHAPYILIIPNKWLENWCVPLLCLRKDFQLTITHLRWIFWGGNNSYCIEIITELDEKQKANKANRQQVWRTNNTVLFLARK